MNGILEFLSNLYWISLPETIAETFWHADWAGAYERAGVAGLIAEAGHSLVGTNSWPFFIPLGGGWSGGDIKKLLNGYGIEVWGEDVANGEYFFRVHKDKASWAQHLLLNSGVPLQHRLLAQKNSRKRHRTENTPETAAGRSLDEWACQTETEIDRAIDGIASALGL